MSHQPNNIFAGTQVVSLVEVRGTNNSLVHRRRAVGLVTRTPTGGQNQFLVRFPDCFEASFTREKLEVLKHFKDQLPNGCVDSGFELERFIISRYHRAQLRSHLRVRQLAPDRKRGYRADFLTAGIAPAVASKITMIAIKIIPARNGDALLITADGAGQHSAMLIDGGYASTFSESLRPELESLTQRGYRLDLLVASHVDADHIMGLVSFFQANGDANAPKIIPVGEVWHNSLRSLTGYAARRVTSNRADEEILADIRSRGFPVPANAEPSEISARQGSSLAALLLSHGYRWNGGNGTRTITGDGYPTIAVKPNLRVKVIRPTASRLDALRQWWIAEMRRLGYMGAIQSDEKFDDAYEFLSSHADFRADHRPEEISHGSSGARSLADVHLPDDSIINGSSIALILEHQTNRVLFLGDAWADDTVASLRALNSGTKPMLFDAVKVAHHGSMRNTSPALLDLVDGPRYIISTNGERHNHPDIEVLKAIVDRPSNFQRALHFNYATPASHFMKSYRSAGGSEFSVVEGPEDWIRIGTSTQL